MSAIISHICSRFSVGARSESTGQAMVEYSLIILLVVIVCIAIVTTVGSIMKNEFYAAIQALP